MARERAQRRVEKLGLIEARRVLAAGNIAALRKGLLCILTGAAVASKTLAICIALLNCECDHDVCRLRCYLVRLQLIEPISKFVPPLTLRPT